MAEPEPAIGSLHSQGWPDHRGVDGSLSDLEHVARYYAKNDKPTSEQTNFRLALRIVKRLYANVAVGEFGPAAFRACRDEMIESGRCRSSINKDVNRVRAMFRWSVEHELVDVKVHLSLQTDARRIAQGTLRRTRGRTPVVPVPIADVEPLLPLVSSPIAALIKLQLLSGAAR